MSEHDKNKNDNEEFGSLSDSTPSIPSEQIMEENNIKPTSRKSTYIINFSLIFIIFIGLFIYMLKVDGIDNMLQVLTQVNYRMGDSRTRLSTTIVVM